MSMFGSVDQDYEVWKESASERGLDSAIADDYEHIIREAFLAGAACVIGGAGKTKKTSGLIEHFLASYRDQVNAGLTELGIMRPS